MPTWTPEKKLSLLIAVITTQKITAHNWDEIARIVGDKFNANACQQQFHKIKRDNAANAGAAGNPSTPSKPTPKKDNTPKSGMDKMATPGSRKRKAMTDATPSKGDPSNGNDDDDDIIIMKKIKSESSPRDRSPTAF